MGPGIKHYITIVIADYRLAYGKAHSGAFTRWFGGKKRIEQALLKL